MTDDKTDIRYLKGIGEKRARLFYKLGVSDVGALLTYYPRNYEDWSHTFSVSNAPLNETCCVKATLVEKVTEHRIRKGMTLYKTAATDGICKLYITIFNNKYAAEKLKPGEEYLFFGKVTFDFNKREMSSPSIEKAEGERIRPIYRLTEGLYSKSVEAAVRAALDMTKDNLYDPLPDSLRTKYSLCHRRYALENIHFPSSYEDTETARKRLVFEELLILQLGLLMIKGRNRNLSGAKITVDYTDDFLKKLPFEATSAQKRAIKEAVDDFKGNTPMNRLLQGDVGSGKTAVAAALCYTVIKNGYQTAIMAPTEILAEQHYRSISKLYAGSGISVCLLTGSSTAREKRVIKEQLKTGEISLIIGTHALIEDTVEFGNLGLVVTDEQHRFGVAQRSALGAKGDNPHMLVMSATPIPRTLALIIYGDLDVSVLDEMPPGRQKIDTYRVNGSYRQRIYNFIKKHLDEGRQGYIVCPLVEEGETDLLAAEEYSRHLAEGAFKGYSVGLLHGKMKAAEKDETMRRFAGGDIQLLVSTTVVEVGVDVPNAVIMVIENAERFGLSQLHQLRGRVGRGEYKSSCILISDAQNEETVKRLDIMTKTGDGFKIAEMDLKLRGPGDFFGRRQHGLPELKIADIFNDMGTYKIAFQAAKDILETDKDLNLPENKGLKQATGELFSSGYTLG